MNSGATAERVYEALRRRILTRAFRPGERLDPAALAETLASSVTPVRDALHLLTGQGLVTTRPGGGFHLPSLDEPGLSDLYAFSCELLLVSTRAWPIGASAPVAPGDLEAGDEAARAAKLFELIAGRSTNAEHLSAVLALNSRLHPARLAEPYVLDGIAAEMDMMSEALKAADPRNLRTLIAAYHRRRRRHSADIVRAVYRAS